MPDFKYQPLFDATQDTTSYRKLPLGGVTPMTIEGKGFLQVEPATIRGLSQVAFDDVSHLLRQSHLEKVAKILSDPEASDNDRFVATELLKNAVIAAERIFPSCQDTGTAMAIGKKGERVLTFSDDAEAISRGVFDAYQKRNLRYSQLAPLSMYEEKNTGTNLPAQVEIYSTSGDHYDFLFIAKGGGSANKSYIFQKTKSVLNPQSMETFIKETISSLGTAACPPYHLAVVIGGPSAEMNLKTVKLASCGYYDHLPTSGNALGRSYRDLEMEKLVEKWGRETKIGAQFGGKYFVHDVRVIRMVRHGASLPIGIGVSCSADRQIKAKITREGVFIEQLEENPAQYLPSGAGKVSDGINLDLSRPMKEILATLDKLPVATRVILNGPLVVARDIAHAKLLERLRTGKGLPDYFKNLPVYYAGPAKTPIGHASGSFGPTTSQRMDPYVAPFQEYGGSMVMLGKGNRTKGVTVACKKFGGFYLGSIGGPAARLGRDCITKVEILEYPELGMEAIWKIEVKDFPAFIIVDNKGNDFFGGRGGEE
ncbi:MAG: fumarate hydratase [Deltaproteobacteria bacterium]|nr:fumarate hydratase [Deltaproteobacteria bacterium]MBI3293198.1 fumarate hydratase [Deltaproteobacteria bacterium]